MAMRDLRPVMVGTNGRAAYVLPRSSPSISSSSLSETLDRDTTSDFARLDVLCVSSRSKLATNRLACAERKSLFGSQSTCPFIRARNMLNAGSHVRWADAVVAVEIAVADEVDANALAAMKEDEK
jgi:hypothetical protein